MNVSVYVVSSHCTIIKGSDPFDGPSCRSSLSCLRVDLGQSCSRPHLTTRSTTRTRRCCAPRLAAHFQSASSPTISTL